MALADPRHHRIKDPSIDSLRRRGDGLANKEAYAIAGSVLEKVARKSQHDRREVVRDHIKRAVVFFIWLGVVLYAAGLVVWVLHLITPDECPINYLTEIGIRKLETIVFSGIAATVAFFVSKNYA